MEKRYRLGVIGGGTMAQAILNGALSRKFLMPSQILVSEPSERNAALLRARGIVVLCDCAAVASQCESLLIAVKPQTFPTVAAELVSVQLPLLLTVMAGMTRASIRSALGETEAPIARIMPNLACAVGEGMSCIDASGLSPAQRQFVLSLFSCSGKVLETDEGLLDAVTGVSGSGPAYVFAFLQALAASAEAQGMTAEQAKLCSFQTVKGALALVEAFPEKGLPQWIGEVCSKGGTTEAAMRSLEKDDFAGAISRAVERAVRRAEELSK